MSYSDRIDAACAAIKQHNEAIGGENNAGYLNPVAFIQCIKASGGTSEERLSALSHEDILECMPSNYLGVAGITGIKPRVLAKEIANIFRSNQSKTNEKDSRPISGKKADKMTFRELVENFDPEDHNNPVGQRLALLSHQQQFIVYSEGRLVDVETTFKLLNEIKSGYPGRTDIDVNGCVKKVYRLGELPENYADENPLYRNRPLRPDGTCDQTGRSWEGIDFTVRQFVRVAMDKDELKVTHEIAHNVLDLVMETDALKKLRQRYRKAAVAFDELAKTGNLPTLKISLTRNQGGSEGKNPFAEGKQVVWGQNPNIPNAYIDGRRYKTWFNGAYSSKVNWLITYPDGKFETGDSSFIV